jgi:hypothetical protein
MFYTIYLTTNKINGKKYIGKHVTDNLQDSYLGSGLAINSAFKKYGRENFQKQILYILDSEEEMNLKEAELVTLDIVQSTEYYNCAIGGHGGAIVLLPEHPLYNITCKKISDAQQLRRRDMSDIVKELHKTKQVGMYGKLQSEHQKNVISLLNKGKPKTKEQKNKQRESITKTFSTPGYVHPNKGVPKLKYTCQWCSKVIGGRSNFNRYHNNNCNNKDKNEF